MQKYTDLVVDSLSSERSITRILSLAEETTPQANAVRMLELADEVLDNSHLKSGIDEMFSKDSLNSTELERARSSYSVMLENLLQITAGSKTDKTRKYSPDIKAREARAD